MVYIEDLNNLKQIIDNNKFTSFSDLSEFVLNDLNDHNLYKFILSPVMEEFIQAYLDKRQSILNKSLIRKYYNDLMDQLIL